MKKILLFTAAFVLAHFALLSQCSEINNIFTGGLEERGSTVIGFIQEDNGDIVFLWEDNIGGDPWTNYDSKIYLTKINSEGQVLWQNEFGGVGYDRSGNLQKVSGGGYVFGGSGRTLGSNWSDSYIFKTDENGNELWRTILGGQSWGQNDGRNILIDEYGNILFYGLGQHHPGCSGYVYRLTQLSPSGELNWSHCYNESQWRGASPIYLESTSEYLFGETINEGIRIIKKGQDGENTYDQDFLPSELVGTGDDLRGKFKKGLNDDYLLISGNPADCFSSSIIKFNAQNVVEWKIIEPCLTAYANDAIVLEDGSWLVQYYEDGDSYFKRLSIEGEILFTSDIIPDLFVSQIGLTEDNDIIYSGRYGLWENGDAVVEVLTCSELTEIDTVTEPTCPIPNYIPTDGLVAYYPFCGNADDLGGDDLNGIIEGATLVEDRFGNTNEAFEFDGNDDYIQSSLIGTEDIVGLAQGSISVWFKRDSNDQATATVFSLYNSTSLDHVTLRIPHTNGAWSETYTAFFGVRNNQTHLVQLTTPNENNSEVLSDNLWHHLVVIIDGVNNRIYLDGIEQPSYYVVGGENTASFTNINNPNILTIGGENNENERYFNGCIDDISIYSRALTNNEIDAIFNSENDQANYICNNQPQGLAPETGGWEYHDFYVPEGMKIDSLFADFQRPGYPVEELDFAWSYCQGCEEYNSNYDVSFFNYTETTNSLYDTWLDATAESFIGPGVARVIAPTNAGVIWEDFCYSLSESECVAPNPCTFNYSQGDLDCDGQVTISDLSVILINFGSMAESELEN